MGPPLAETRRGPYSCPSRDLQPVPGACCWMPGTGGQSGLRPSIRWRSAGAQAGPARIRPCRPGGETRRSAMTGIKSLWASVQGDPVVMRRVNGWLTIFWILMIPVSMWTHWISSVTYVAALSLWALVSGHWSAWQAARVEVNQQQEAKKREEEDVPGEV